MLIGRVILVSAFATVFLAGCGGSDATDDGGDTTTTTIRTTSTAGTDDGGDTTTSTSSTTSTIGEEAAVGVFQIQVNGADFPLEVESCDVSATELNILAFDSQGGSAAVRIPAQTDFGPTFDTFEAGTKETILNVEFRLVGVDFFPEGWSLTLNADLRSGSFTSINPEGITGTFSCG